MKLQCTPNFLKFHSANCSHFFSLSPSVSPFTQTNFSFHSSTHPPIPHLNRMWIISYGHHLRAFRRINISDKSFMAAGVSCNGHVRTNGLVLVSSCNAKATTLGSKHTLSATQCSILPQLKSNNATATVTSRQVEFYSWLFSSINIFIATVTVVTFNCVIYSLQANY